MSPAVPPESTRCGRLSAGERAVGYRLGEAGVEVVAACHRQFARERARRQIVGHPRVDTGPSCRKPWSCRRIGSYVAPMRGAQLFFSVKSKSHSIQRLLLVAQAGIDGQPVSDSPRVLHEQRLVVLRRRRTSRERARVTR